MGDTTVVTHLFVLGIISILVNSVLLITIAALSSAVGGTEVILAKYKFIHEFQPLFLSAVGLSFIFILFYVAYAIVAIIGIILGFLYKDRMRKIGVKMLIVINAILIPIFLLNCIFFIAAFISESGSRYSSVFVISASLSVAVSVCQCILFV